MPFLYLIAIAWIFVVLMMAITESSFIAGIMTFIFYCIIPLSLVLYILSSSARKRKLRAEFEAKRQAMLDQTKETTPAKSE
jgi:ABC-type transport system involved in cytochrome bd biosynthesis fused ATPase/permease subunit